MNVFKREILTVIILIIGIALLGVAPGIALAVGIPDLSPVLFKIGMGAVVVSLWRWVLRMLMPWFRAHEAWESALYAKNTAAAICLLSYVLLLMASWWLAAVQ